ncbi:MAG: hypothetical protein EOO16_12560 [Chitinophagaceae bacterium]|nr:MAG: hypothetical protein EOO16_12560 [Chitinophagaceae bacterium]
MPSQSETGHAVNLANAQGLYDFCQVLGAAYKPAQPRFKLPAFAQQIIESKDAQERAEAARRAVDDAINPRADLFDGLGPFVTRAMRSFRTCGATERTVADAEAVARKLQGSRATTPEAPAADGTGARTRSVSQKSFDMQLANFNRFIGHLSGAREYAPGEEDLTVDALKARHEAMDTANKACAAPAAVLTEALVRRDLLFYAPKTGLVDTCLGIKEYVLSMNKAKNPGIGGVARFKFRNLRQRLQKAGLA